MKLLKNEKVINIIENTLNCVDARLIDHGKRVAYRVYKMLEAQNTYDDIMLRDICILAMLHDIGAYKTEEIDNMVTFEGVNVWEHSVYGYLFLKYFSPLKHLAPAILFHHASCKETECLDPFLRELAQIIFLCDRADVFSCRSSSYADFLSHLEKVRDITFYSGVIEKFRAAAADLVQIDDIINSDEKFNSLLYDTPLSGDEASRYLEMIIFAIESRSRQTVIHTIATVKITVTLGRLLGVDAQGLEILETGALLHDIGKTGVPVHILESTNRLNTDEFAIMKSHVDFTGKIIEGSVDEEIRDLAVSHHEKTNGSGYPKGIPNPSLYIRILAIADILSALCGERTYKKALSKDEIAAIITGMSVENMIDPEITALAIQHYDDILAEVNTATKPTLDVYTAILDEYRIILDCVRRADFKAIRL
ncbi:MAG: HD domain-containing protein [Spirochaetota bacterium]|jgi:putative nucleotidyltransferase with HDIG domain|nr:HD domain-containing protein [Spirochaetota bacterium]